MAYSHDRVVQTEFKRHIGLGLSVGRSACQSMRKEADMCMLRIFAIQTLWCLNHVLDTC